MIELNLIKPLPTAAIDALNKMALGLWECKRVIAPGFNTPLWKLTIVPSLTKTQRYELYGALDSSIPDFESRKLTHS